MSTLRSFVAICLIYGSFTANANIINYWRFEEGNGGFAADEVGGILGDLNGTANSFGWSANVPAANVPLTGVANNGSIYFGPVWVDITTPQAMNLGTSFTIEYFFNAQEPVLSSPMFALSNGPFLRAAFLDTADFTDHILGFYFGSQSVLTSADLITLNEWHHFALVKTPGYFSVFIDGSLQGEGSLPSSTDGPYIFGGSPETGDRSIGNGFRGYLDEFRISDEALTPDQFLMAPEPGTLGLLALGGLALYATRRRIRSASSSCPLPRRSPRAKAGP